MPVRITCRTMPVTKISGSAVSGCLRARRFLAAALPALLFAAAGLALSTAATPAAAQSKAAKPAPAKDPSGEFNKVLGEWKKVIAELRQKNMEYRRAKPDERDKILAERKQILAQGEALEPKLIAAASAAYIAAPDKNKDAADLLSQMAADDLKRDQFAAAQQICDVLMKQGFDNKQVIVVAGKAAYDMNDFAEAAKLLKVAAEAQLLSQEEVGMLISAEDSQPKWEAEKKIREAEAKADDLPRVKLSTTKGDVVLELFENEAPNTVANFISLVEQGTYNGTPFHRVLPGFMAQGGDPEGTGNGGPGYAIPCECYTDNHRLHFRGALSMALARRDTGGSQFFITFVPTPGLDGKHTVFGRVLSGQDVVDSIQRRDPEAASPPEPDKIVTAEVLRKRDHEYVPKKVGESTGPELEKNADDKKPADKKTDADKSADAPADDKK